MQFFLPASLAEKDSLEVPYSGHSALTGKTLSMI
jgi:hypothetical protein